MIISLTTSKSFSIPSMLIKAIEKRPYSHIALSWYSPSIERQIYYHSTSMGVHFLNSDNFEKDNKVVKHFKLHLNRDRSKAMLQKCVDLAGMGYDFVNIAKIAVNKFLSLFGTSVNWKPSGENKNICSELIVNVLHPLFPLIKLTKAPDFYTPSDVDALLDEACELYPSYITKLY